ncbi:MAG: hypothetical protein ACREN5_09810 [Gemmatimonadales bacterium]
MVGRGLRSGQAPPGQCGQYRGKLTVKMVRGVKAGLLTTRFSRPLGAVIFTEGKASSRARVG